MERLSWLFYVGFECSHVNSSKRETVGGGGGRFDPGSRAGPGTLTAELGPPQRADSAGASRGGKRGHWLLSRGSAALPRRDFSSAIPTAVVFRPREL